MKVLRALVIGAVVLGSFCAPAPLQAAKRVDPFGKLELSASPQLRTMRVAGWAIDPSDFRRPVAIRAYVGGTAGVSDVERHDLGLADNARPDIADRYPRAGANHGFDTTFQTERTGAQTVCTYAVDVGKGKNKLLACVSVEVSAAYRPFDAIDVASSGDLWLAGLTKSGTLLVRDKPLGQPWNESVAVGDPGIWARRDIDAGGPAATVALAGVTTSGSAFVTEKGAGPWGQLLQRGEPDIWSDVDVEIGPSGETWLLAVTRRGTVWAREKPARAGWGDFVQLGAATNYSEADLEIGPAGEVWLAALTLNGTIYVREKPAGGEWGEGLQRGSAFSYSGADIEIGPSGEVWLVGLTQAGTILTRSKPSEGEWDEFVQHGDTAGYDAADLEVGPSGEATLATITKDGRLFLSDKPAGAPWSALTQFETASTWYGADIELGPSGEAWLAALTRTGTMYVATRAGAGWSALEQQGATGSWSL